MSGLRDALELTLGGVIGMLVVVLIVIGIFYRRYRVLAEADFELFHPPVPRTVTEAVKEAEARAYAAVSSPRRLLEHLQDISAFVLPGLTYRFDFSVGRYRIKASTIERVSVWAMDEGYLVMHSEPNRDLPKLLPYFSVQPSTNDWQVSVILESLRRDHPELAAMDWDEIAADPALVAKVYSGYMGAGGDWDGWRASLTPGAVARERMLLD